MARIKKITQQPLPESGERVMMPKEGGKFSKPPKAMTSAEKGKARKASQQRKDWEATPEGKARTTGYQEESGIGVGMRHFLDNYDKPGDIGPRVYDVQLPGMADPNAAPRPPKWEELTDAQRAHTERGLKMQGTSIDQMTSDFGAQLDQAHARAQRNGQDPYASRFYEPGSAQRDRISQSAHELGVPASFHAMTNSFTSPNTKFEIKRADGTTAYPNDEAAVHATKWVQQGGKAEDITNELSTTGMAPEGNPDRKAQGYTTNIRKAARAVEQHLAGVAPADMRIAEPSKTTGKVPDRSPFELAPKTGPYANSWNDSHPQFTVGDVHTAGGGAFPHLGYDKPYIMDEAGNPKLSSGGKETRDKSGRERAIEQTPFAHSAVDFANRQAMKQRNMGSVRRSQAMQWGEEQLQRGESGLRGAPRERQAYPDAPKKQEMEGQGSLFENTVTHTGVRKEMTNPEALPGAKTEAQGRKDRSSFATKLGLDF